MKLNTLIANNRLWKHSQAHYDLSVFARVVDVDCEFCIIRIYQHICNAFCSFTGNMTTKHRLHTKLGNLFPANEESSE